MTIALIALFVALGGTGYAALKLPKDSVGSKQLKADAVRSSKVKDGSLLSRDFRTGELPGGPAGERGLQGEPGIQGPQGDKGDPCLPSDPSCKGPKGDTGAPGPGATSISTQVTRDGLAHVVTEVDHVRVVAGCSEPGSANSIGVSVISTGQDLYGWGYKVADGTLSPVIDSFGVMNSTSTSTSRVQLDVVASINDPEFPVKFVEIHVDGLLATGCNIHGFIVPAS